MMISEMIAELEALKQMYGDLPVSHSNICGDYGVSYREVQSIEYDIDKYGNEKISLNKVY
jgi:hypothetical protein